MPNESAEKREEKWYEREPYKTIREVGDGYEVDFFDIPAILKEERRIERERIKEIVEEEMHEEVNLAKHCANKLLHDSCTNCIQGRIWLWHGENILSRIDQDKPKP